LRVISVNDQYSSDRIPIFITQALLRIPEGVAVPAFKSLDKEFGMSINQPDQTDSEHNEYYWQQ
jgi:hypothetical protein